MQTQTNSIKPAKKVRVALVGAGYMAGEHARAFRDIPEVELTGVHGRTRSKAEHLARLHNIRVVADSIPELYERTFADLVILCVPELSARSICESAFQFPWISLAEKPVGHHLEEAREIFQMCRNRKSKAFVALNRRHYWSTRALLNGLREDPEPRFIQILDQQDMQAARDADQPEEVIRNWMYANSIHLVDYLSFLARGDLEKTDQPSPWNSQSPGTVIAHLRFSSGDQALYQACWNAPGPWAVAVTTSGRRFEARPLEKLGVQLRGSRNLEFQPDHDWDIKFKSGLRAQAEEAVKAVRGEAHGLPTLEEGLRTMELVARIYGKDKF